MATRKELLEQYEDARFALLMDEIMEMQGAEINEIKQQLNRDPAAAVPPEVREHSLDTIRTSYDKQDRKKKSRSIKTTVRTLLIAAIVSALLFSTVSADLRLAAKNFVYVLNDLAAELMFDFGKDDAETHDGEVIMGYFIPALPKEFELIGGEDQSNGKYAWRKYQSDAGFVMIYISANDGSGFTYGTDTENADAVQERINQFDVLVIDSTGRVQFVLSDTTQNIYIEITSNTLTYEELKEFVTRIKNS